MVTVKEILGHHDLRQLKVLAGHAGLDRKVSSVSVMDAPDISDWMTGNEFLITSGYVIKDDLQDLSKLIDRLNRKGVSALGIKLGRFFKEIPDDAFTMADRLEFPLISIPHSYPFTRIINPVLGEIISSQTARLLETETIHKEFLALAMKSADIKDILDLLSHKIGCEIAFIDTYFRCLFLSTNSIDSDYFEHLIRLTEANDFEIVQEQFGDEYKFFAVDLESQNLGYIVVKEKCLARSPLHYSQAAIEYAGIIIRLYLQQKISNIHIERKHRDEFISDLIFNNIKSEVEAQNRAQIFNIDGSQGAFVVIVDIDDVSKNYINEMDSYKSKLLEEKIKTITDISEDIMKAYFPSCVSLKMSDHIVYLVPCTSPDNSAYSSSLDLAKSEIVGRLRQKDNHTITMAVGNYYKKLMDIHKSYDEARIVVKICSRFKERNQVLKYKDLGIYRLITEIDNDVVLNEYLVKYIQPLSKYDAQHDSNLLHTLNIIEKNAWNLKKSSKELFIHYNTTKHRFAKISEILELNLKNYTEQLNVTIALRIYDLR